ncbi:MAG: hypothetical protein ABFS08_05100 [Pseudomonadota bacterium]
MESNTIINQWLNDLAFSAATWDINAHMELISKNVIVLGIPGVDRIDYQGWMKRRRNEFKKKLLHSLIYREPKMVSERPQFITFSVQELMKDHAKQCIEISKEVTLHQEQDGKWRVVREQILNVDAKKACHIA